mgnify:CR=1 FL=1
MFKKLIVISIFSLTLYLTFSASSVFQTLGNKSQEYSVRFAFITRNGYGNNLYIDNLTIGEKPLLDATLIGINIKKDTIFVPGSGSPVIYPKAVICNIGRTPFASGVSVTLVVDEIGYISADTVFSLAAGQSQYVTFDSISNIPLSENLSFVTYIGSLEDSLEYNDSLSQKTIFLPSFERIVLLEEFTNVFSPAAAGQDKFLDIFSNVNFNKVSSVRYHTGIINTAVDSMYLDNPQDIDNRQNYYSVTSVPFSTFDAKVIVPFPYANTWILDSLLKLRSSQGSPVSVSVIDSNVSGNIHSTVNINVIYPVPPGDYRLRLMAVQRRVQYQTKQGLTEDTIFYDVFRDMLPDSAGIPVTLNPGSYQYTINYPINPSWTDSLIYSVAFIQNDRTKEIINSGKGRNFTLDKIQRFTKWKDYFKADFIKKIQSSSYAFPYKSPKLIQDTNSYNFETFEGVYPPAGWEQKNADGLYSFEPAFGANGNQISGLVCVRIPFYGYSNIGAIDTLITDDFKNVSLFDTIRFDYAYAQYLSSYVDSLTVIASLDSGNTWTQIFSKSGNLLSTSPSTTLSFFPVNASEWKTFQFPFSELIDLYPPLNPNVVFELDQNYPNPFNPVTKINYRLSSDNFVTLKIYDITGRVIKVLVNEFKQKGRYSVDFSASTLSSGIYFYVMTAGGTKEARKMIILK